MRVLFLESHPMWIHGLPNGFRDLGHEVMVSGSLTVANIRTTISTFKPQLIVMMGWTDEHTALKQRWISLYVKPTKIPLIYWATEDPTHTQRFTLPLVKNIRPDFIFTICPSRVNDYHNIGLRAAHLDFGYHQKIHHRTAPQEQYRCSIAVVANAYPKILTMYPEHFRINSLKTLIQPLLKANIRVDFWGRHWDCMEPLIETTIPTEWLHGYLDYPEAAKIYSSADIVIGLQNHPTQLTQRTYEILGSEGFLLTSDTPEIRRWFVPGADLIVSASPDETVDQVRYYSEHPEEREKIRQQSGTNISLHSYKFRAQQMIEVLCQNNILDSTE